MSEEFRKMTIEERHAQVEGYLGKSVSIEIDRPIGYVHHKGEKTLVYPINYGYIPDPPINECEGDFEENKCNGCSEYEECKKYYQE